MSQQVICEKCNSIKDLPKLKRKVLDNLIYEYYWRCTKCNHKYVSYYTDKKIRRDIKRNVKRRKQFAKTQTVDESRKLLAEIKMNEKLIKKNMDKLKDKILKASTV